MPERLARNELRPGKTVFPNHRAFPDGRTTVGILNRRCGVIFTICFPVMPAGIEVVRNANQRRVAQIVLYLFEMPRRALHHRESLRVAPGALG